MSRAAGYGRFVGVPDRADLERCFYLDDEDRLLVGLRRGDHNRLGFALQLSTVRFLGVFLEDPLDVPSDVVDYVAVQLEIADSSVLKRYTERSKTAYEHSWEITEAFGFRQFTSPTVRDGLVEFLRARAWTQAERPSQLFDRAVAWLRRERVLLPGVSILARLVVEVRTGEAERLQSMIAARLGPHLVQRLDALLNVADVSRWSNLELLRRAPVRASGPEMVRALDRATALADVGAGEVDVSDVPTSRWVSLARYGLSSKAAMLRRMPDNRRLVTMLATVEALRVEAFDDAIELFANLMSTKLIRVAERKSDRDRLWTLPQLSRASSMLAATAKVLLDAADAEGSPSAAAELWARLDGVATRDQLSSAIDTINVIVPPTASPMAWCEPNLSNAMQRFARSCPDCHGSCHSNPATLVSTRCERYGASATFQAGDECRQAMWSARSLRAHGRSSCSTPRRIQSIVAHGVAVSCVLKTVVGLPVEVRSGWWSSSPVVGGQRVGETWLVEAS